MTKCQKFLHTTTPLTPVVIFYVMRGECIKFWSLETSSQGNVKVHTKKFSIKRKVHQVPFDTFKERHVFLQPFT